MRTSTRIHFGSIIYFECGSNLRPFPFVLLVGCKGRRLETFFFPIKNEGRREGIDCMRVVIEPHSTGVDVV